MGPRSLSPNISNSFARPQSSNSQNLLTQDDFRSPVISHNTQKIPSYNLMMSASAQSQKLPPYRLMNASNPNLATSSTTNTIGGFP